jgi:WXG100 family type VII secretion target
MPGYDVSPAELRSTRTFVDGIAHDVLAEVSKVGRDVDDLLDSGWTGGSAHAFARGWAEWKTAARDTLRALDTMAELLGQAGRDYADSDVFVADCFARFAS